MHAVVLGTIAGLLHPRRPGDPHLPPAHHRAGLHRDHAQRQAHVRGPRRRIVLGLADDGARRRAGGEEHNYRITVSPWFRSLFVLQPDVDAMAAAPLLFQLHALIAMAAVRASGRSPGSCTRSPRRSATCSGPTSSTAAATTPARRPPAAARLGGGRSGGVATAVTAAHRLPERCAQRGGPPCCATPTPRGAWPAAHSRRPPVRHRDGRDLGGARRHQRQRLLGVVGNELCHEVVPVRGDGTVHGVDVVLVQRSQALDERIISERADRAHPGLWVRTRHRDHPADFAGDGRIPTGPPGAPATPSTTGGCGYCPTGAVSRTISLTSTWS